MLPHATLPPGPLPPGLSPPAATEPDGPDAAETGRDHVPRPPPAAPRPWHAPHGADRSSRPARWRPGSRRPAVDPGADPGPVPAAARGPTTDVPPPKRSRRGLVITSVVLGLVVLLCGGGGARRLPAAPRRRHRRGRARAGDAVERVPDGRLQGAGREPGRRQLVCREARDRPTRSTAKVDEVKNYAKAYREPTASTGEPRRSDEQDAEHAIVSVDLHDDHRRREDAEQQLQLHGGPARPVGGSARSAEPIAVATLDACRQRSGPIAWPARLHVVTGKGGTGKTTRRGRARAGARRRRPAHPAGRGRGPAGHRPALRHRAAALRGTRIADAPPAAARSARSPSTPRRRCSSTSRCSTSWARPAGRCARSARSTSPPRSPRACATCCSPARSRRRRPAPRDGRRVYDAVVLDAPPTGRIGRFLNVTAETARLAKIGPIKTQSEGVAALLRSPMTSVHVVTLLEEMPVQETRRRDRRADRAAASRSARSSSTAPGRRC